MPFFNTHTSKCFLSYNGNELKAFPDCLPQHYLKKWNFENVDIILTFRKLCFIFQNTQNRYHFEGYLNKIYVHNNLPILIKMNMFKR